MYFNDFKFIRFMTIANPSNRNETKSDIFPWDIFFKSDVIYFFYQKILKYFNEF